MANRASSLGERPPISQDAAPSTSAPKSSLATTVEVPARRDWRASKVKAPQPSLALATSGAAPRSVRIAREGAHELVLALYPDHPLLLGRDAKCNVVFPSTAVSREHARLWMRE